MNMDTDIQHIRKWNEIFLAELISRIFDFYTIAPLSILLYFLTIPRLDPFIALYWYFILVLFFSIFPVLFLILRNSEGKLADYEFTERIKRIPYESGALFLFLIPVVLSVYLQNSIYITKLAMLFFVLVLCILILTLLFKISIHASSATLLSLMIIKQEGVIGYLSLAAIAMIYWSRIYLKKHNIFQLLSGSLLTVAIYFLIIGLG